MIIKRKYEWLGELYEKDSLARNVIDIAFQQAGVGEDKKKQLLEYNHCNIPAFMNLGCGIPGESYRFFMDRFEELDKTDPYDNGLTFKDVGKIEYETSHKGTAIQLRLLVNEIYDLPYRIVGFVAIDNKDGKLHINKGWDMTAPFTIG